MTSGSKMVPVYGQYVPVDEAQEYAAGLRRAADMNDERTMNLEVV